MHAKKYPSLALKFLDNCDISHPMFSSKITTTIIIKLQVESENIFGVAES